MLTFLNTLRSSLRFTVFALCPPYLIDMLPTCQTYSQRIMSSSTPNAPIDWEDKLADRLLEFDAVVDQIKEQVNAKSIKEFDLQAVKKRLIVLVSKLAGATKEVQQSQASVVKEQVRLEKK